MNRRSFLSAIGVALATAAVPAIGSATSLDAAPVWIGIDSGGLSGDIAITITLDTAALSEQIAGLSALWLEAGDIPESVLNELRGLVENISDELVLGSPMSAGRAGEHVASLRLREGGQLDRCAAALRAFRDGNS